MDRNIEIKARVADYALVQAAVERLAPLSAVLEQTDTFFRCPQGRLKLREFSDAPAELLYYEREAAEGQPKQCNYFRYSITNPKQLIALLSAAHGIRGVVKKKRFLHLIGRHRIHLDIVEGLGKFIEIEVVLDPEQTPEEGRLIMDELMQSLGIAPADILDVAYIDLLESK